ncbi:hypothetical protein BGZ65_009912 [Modicella reniformis]|uniref:Uncharacterized protein n=1 Tax=Modicella reniformis TaxID=1440133 RepID=A0A9P6LRK6_9FUNG|nr:hypothetical protein BGZ65_009912 [Modicella reniformis]
MPSRPSIPTDTPTDVPAALELVTTLGETDREDGEISDDDISTGSGSTSDPNTGKESEDNAVSRINVPGTSSITTTPQQAPTQSLSLNHQISQEKQAGYIQRTTSTVPKLTRVHVTGSKNRNRNLDGIKTRTVKDADFTTLMAEYQLQKAKTDIKPKTAAVTLEQTTVSDIPGLGQIKNPGRSFMEPSDSERNTRPYSSHGSHHNDPSRLPGYKRQRARKPEYISPHSRDLTPTHKDHSSDSQGASYKLHLPRYQSDAHPDPPAPSAVFSDSSPHDFAADPAPQSTPIIYCKWVSTVQL